MGEYRPNGNSEKYRTVASVYVWFKKLNMNSLIMEQKILNIL